MAGAAVHLPHTFSLRRWHDGREGFIRRCDSPCPCISMLESAGSLVRVGESEATGCRILGRSVPMNCCSALSVSSCVNFLPSSSSCARGRFGARRFHRDFTTFTHCHREALGFRQQAGKLVNGHAERNSQRQSGSFSRIYSSGDGYKTTDTGQEITEISASDDEPLPTMEEIQEVAREQGLKIEVRTLGPWFQINLMSVDEKETFGTAEGFETRWIEGKILHLEAIRLTRSAPKGKSILGPGFLVGAAAVRYGLDKNCPKAELLAINDDDETHAKLVKYYSRLGFEATYELTGEGWTELLDRVVWGGVGTRMDADCEELLRKWAKALRPRSKRAGLNLNPSKGFSKTQTLEKVQQQK